MTQIEEVMIIGAGPAGLAAAMQLVRYGLCPQVFEREAAGGLLRNANWVENYPGFPAGIAGPRLARLIERQAQRAGVQIIFQPVTDLRYEGSMFRAATPKGTALARVAVIASGTQPRLLSGLIIPEGLRPLIFYEVYLLLGVGEQRIVIVGAGDAAFDYALNLSRQNDVIILNRGTQVKCLPLLWERAKACPRIKYHPATWITRLEPAPGGGMTVECSSPAGAVTLHANSLLGAIGREPQLDFVSAALLKQASDLENRGILHFVGDVKNDLFRQTAIAVGDGVLAAMRIARLLKEEPL